MKYIQFAIMAVLIFGVAASPIFSNGFAFAQVEDPASDESEQEQTESTAEETESTAEETESTAEETESTATSTQEERISIQEERASTQQERASQAEQRASDKSERASDKVQRESDKTERSSDAQSIRESRLANVEEQRSRLADRIANLPEERRQMIQERLEAMQQQRGLIQNSTQSHANFMDLSDEDRQSQLDEIRENRLAQREARMHMTPEERQTLFEENKARMMEVRANYVSPRDQIGFGVPTDEIICVEGKELVIRVTSGMPICLSSDAVILLMDRGIVAYPE